MELIYMVNIADSDDPLLFYLKFCNKIILEFDLKLSIHSFAYVFCFIQQGEAKKALQMLRKPAVPIDLQVQIKFRIWNIEPLGLYPSLQCTGCRFFLFCFFIVLKSPVIYLHLLPYQLADLSCLSETIILEKTITDGLPTLQYKFAPDLIMLDAYETVESWMTTNNLNPRKLIPAMMRYSSEPHAK